MATDLETRPDEDQDAIQRHYDDTFNDLTSAEHMAKDGTPGDVGGDESGFFRNEDTPKVSSDTPDKSESKAKKDATKDTSGDSGLFGGDESGPGKGRRVLGFNITRRRTITAGIISLVLGGGGLFMGSIATGPLELLHLSELFSHNLSKVESDSSSRTGSMMRNARAWQNKDFRYTRVGYIGARIVNGVLDDYEKSGFKFTDPTPGGRPNSIEIDREKVRQSFPETKNMSPEQLDKWASETLGVEFKNGKADMSGLSDRSIKKVSKSANRKLLGDGRVKSGIRARELGKFYGLNNLFHPFSAALDGKIAKAVAAAKAKKAQDNNNPSDETASQAAESTVQTEQAANRAPIEAKAEGKLSEFRSEHSGLADGIVKWGGQAAGIIWATGCTLRDAGDTITVINRDAIVIPSMLQATQLMAAGAQIKAGTIGQKGDLTEEQVGALADGLIDKNGQAIWSATPMEALVSSSNLSTKNDIPDDQKKAFGQQGMGGKLSDVGNSILQYVGLKATASVIGDATDWIPGVKHLGLSNPCSLTYAGVTVAVGLAGYVADVGSCLVGCEGFALSAAVDGLVTGIVKESESFFLSSLAIGKITDFLIHSNAPAALAKDAFSGPAGGALLAYGAREAGNMTAIASGGLEIVNSAATTIVGTAGQEDQQQFRSQSMFAKVFDTNDYRSLTGQLADTLNRGLSHNTNSAISSMVNPFHSIGTVFGNILNPKALAGTPNSSWTGSYDWGMSQYGIPDNLLSDSRVADPFQNAEDVGQYLTDHCGSDANAASEGECGGDNGWTNRIKGCFGNDLTYTQDSTTNTMVWDVAPAANTDVDPNSSDYKGHNCSSDLSGEWGKIVMFVNDASNIKSMDCLEGDNDTSGQSCSDLGVAGAAANVCTGTATAGTTPSTSSSSSLPSWSVMPDVSSQPIGGAVSGKVSMAIANIRSSDTFTHNLSIIDHNNPDFIGIQETSNETVPYMEQSAPGYGVYRDNTPDPDSADTNQVMDNTIMWNKGRWELLASGRIKITNHDHVVFEGSNKDWNRYAAWGMFKRKSDGAIVSFVSTHMMTAPDGQKQWGTLDPPMTRAQQYELSMQNLKQLVGVLAQHGPVLVGGDMNVTENDSRSWAPGPQMKAAGYSSSSDGRVLLSFNPQGTTVANNQLVHLELHGDHNDGSIQTAINMNGVGPGAFIGSVANPSASCAATGGSYINNLKPGNAETPDPSIVKGDDGTYHIYASGFQHLTSTDAVKWKVSGGDSQIFAGSVPSWLGSDHWAPEVSKTGDHWTLVFSGGTPKQIGYATSSSAGGPFTYQGVLVPPDSSESGYVIDPHLLSIDGGGYILYYGSDKNHGVSAVKLSLNGDKLSRQGQTIQALKPDMDQYTTEGAYVVKHDNWYYMYYSVGDYRVHGDYRTRIARSQDPFALFSKKSGGNTILDGNSAFVGPGGGSVLTDDLGQDWMYYHAQAADGNNDRLLMLDKILYGGDGWPTINNGNGPSSTKQLGPNASSASSGSTTTTTPNLSSVKNFRDASGTNNALKSGVLYRSGQLNQLSDADSTTLSNLLGKNGTIIDLRSAYQRQKAPDVSVPGVKTIDIPIDGILDQTLMVTDATRRTQLGKALKAAENAPGAVLIHCVDGKDRTGWAVAMIMYVSGASDDEVMNEYMASQTAFPDGVKEAWLNDGLAAAKSKYGSPNDTNAQAVIKYLKKGAGLSDSDLQKIRNKFEEPASDASSYQ